MAVRKEVVEAAEDLRYLLARGYRREPALKLVGDKRQLSRLERLMLYRGVYDEGTAKARRGKLADPTAASGRRLAVDGYNVLITLEAALSGAPLILCDDGVVRDLTASHGKHKPTERTLRALRLLIEFLKKVKPGETNFFFDSQVGGSGKLAAMVGRMLAEAKLRGSAKAVKRGDKAALLGGEIIATSDSALIDKARLAIDIAQKIIMEKGLAEPVKLSDQGRRRP